MNTSQHFHFSVHAWAIGVDDHHLRHTVSVHAYDVHNYSTSSLLIYKLHNEIIIIILGRLHM